MGVFLQIHLPRDARNLMDRLLCDVDDRLGSNGVQELKVGLQHTCYVCVDASHSTQHKCLTSALFVFSTSTAFTKVHGYQGLPT